MFFLRNALTRSVGPRASKHTVSHAHSAHFQKSNILPFSSSTNTVHEQSSSTTHFGFRDVPEQEKQGMVNSVFANVAHNYDVMNDLMSAGLHRLWKDHVVSTLDPQPADGKRSGKVTFLDVAGGTGDVAFRIIERLNQSIRERGLKQSQTEEDGLPRTEVVVCDINPSMLEVGEQRARALGYTDTGVGNDVHVSFKEGNAEVLDGIADESIDAYTICFGIRNCTHVDRVLEQAYRVLKPGGIFMCLEFSQVVSLPLRQIYDLYSFNVIPLMGQFVANDSDSYQYLVESIRKFPDQETFKSMIERAGFKYTRYENLTFGVVAVHMGVKL